MKYLDPLGKKFSYQTNSKLTNNDIRSKKAPLGLLASLENNIWIESVTTRREGKDYWRSSAGLPQLQGADCRAGAAGGLVPHHLPAVHPGLHRGGQAARRHQDLRQSSTGGNQQEENFLTLVSGQLCTCHFVVYYSFKFKCHIFFSCPNHSRQYTQTHDTHKGLQYLKK